MLIDFFDGADGAGQVQGDIATCVPAVGRAKVSEGHREGVRGYVTVTGRG